MRAMPARWSAAPAVVSADVVAPCGAGSAHVQRIEGLTKIHAAEVRRTVRERRRVVVRATVVPRERRARSALLELGQGDEPSREAALDEALRAGDLERARTLASSLSLRPSALAWRALDASSPKLALEQTKLVLGADPSDTDAWVVALAAADELGDEARFLEVLALLDPEPLPPSPRAVALLGGLLTRHAGADASAPAPTRPSCAGP